MSTTRINLCCIVQKGREARASRLKESAVVVVFMSADAESPNLYSQIEIAEQYRRGSSSLL